MEEKSSIGKKQDLQQEFTALNSSVENNVEDYWQSKLLKNMNKANWNIAKLVFELMDRVDSLEKELADLKKDKEGGKDQDQPHQESTNKTKEAEIE